MLTWILAAHEARRRTGVSADCNREQHETDEKRRHRDSRRTSRVSDGGRTSRLVLVVAVDAHRANCAAAGDRSKLRVYNQRQIGESANVGAMRQIERFARSTRLRVVCSRVVFFWLALHTKNLIAEQSERAHKNMQPKSAPPHADCMTTAAGHSATGQNWCVRARLSPSDRRERERYFLARRLCPNLYEQMRRSAACMFASVEAAAHKQKAARFLDVDCERASERASER